jgi:multiple sugar transport system ATP-binding protein
MRAEIASLQTRLGVTTLYVTHDQIEAMTMGDRVAVLKRGELQQVASPQDLYEHPDNLFVAGFIGSPSMNLGQGGIESRDGGLFVNFGPQADVRLSDAALRHYPRVKEYVGREVAVGMRPEHFFRADGSTPEENQMKQRDVMLVELLGSEVLVHFGTEAKPVITEDLREAIDDPEAFAELEQAAATGTQQFVARLDPHEAPKMGQKIDLAFKTEHMHFFDIETGQALR